MNHHIWNITSTWVLIYSDSYECSCKENDHINTGFIYVLVHFLRMLYNLYQGGQIFISCLTTSSMLSILNTSEEFFLVCYKKSETVSQIIRNKKDFLYTKKRLFTHQNKPFYTPKKDFLHTKKAFLHTKKRLFTHQKKTFYTPKKA